MKNLKLCIILLILVITFLGYIGQAHASYGPGETIPVEVGWFVYTTKADGTPTWLTVKWTDGRITTPILSRATGYNTYFPITNRVAEIKVSKGGTVELGTKPY